jgi:beta-lactamase class A
MDFSFQKHNFKRSLISSVTLMLFFAAGVMVDRIYTATINSGASNSKITVRQSDLNQATYPYRFIDPLLACDVSEKKEATEFVPLKIKIQSLISEKVNSEKADLVSVYFDTRDVNWLNINPSEKYSPASLMKVPAAIAYLKGAEESPAVLQNKMLYDGSFDFNKLEYFKPKKVITPNNRYIVDDLLFRMLGYSDNNAYYILVNNMDGNILNEVYSDLGIVWPKKISEAQDDFITVKQYANFFKVLYNASYLERDTSEKALSFLSQTDFPQGIIAGVPKDKNITIAHKFGERNFGNTADPASQKELHDCGIIYYPDRHYLLCIMTKGTNFDNLAGTIRDISSTVYQYIDQEKKK